jgi:phospholipid transport system transporter-binding protein
VSDIAIEAVGDGKYRVSGELNFDTVTQALNQSKNMFDQAADVINVDLGGITRTNSAGIALLIEWLRAAKQKHKEVLFHHIPEKMLAIAKVSDLADILPLADNSTD